MNLAVVRYGASSLLCRAQAFGTRNSDKILLGVGLLSETTAIVMACKATPKALELKASRKRDEKESKAEALGRDILAMAPAYAPTAIVWAAGTACIIGSSHIQSKANAVLAAACATGERALYDYQQNVIENLGQDVHDKIMGTVPEETRKKLDEECPFDEGASFKTFDDEVVVFDKVLGRKFTATPAEIRKAEVACMERVLDQHFCPVRELYFNMAIDDGSDIGDVLYWDPDCKPKIYFDWEGDKSDRPYLVINYRYRVADPAFTKFDKYDI